MNMKVVKALILLIFAFTLLSCGKPKGEFAFKLPEDKGYKKVIHTPEFDSAVEVDWIYTFDRIRGRVNLGVIILKKELLWIDILAYSDYADSEKKIVYGRIKGLDPGDYRIMITEIGEEEQTIIDELYFYIYTDREEWD